METLSTPSVSSKKEEDTDPLFNQSLEKGLAVLSAFDEQHQALTLNELAELTGMNRASVQRSVHTLQVLGYMYKNNKSRRFCLLPKVLRLGFNYVVGNPLIRIAHPYLSQLATACGETVNLTEPDGTDMVYTSQLATLKFIPVLTPVGMRIPMYCSSSGRAYLSGLPDEQILQILKNTDLQQRTPFTLTKIDPLLKKIEQCRKSGYTINDQELFIGDMGIASPVRTPQGDVIGAIHISPPAARWNVSDIEQKLAPILVECARAVSNVAAI